MRAEKQDDLSSQERRDWDVESTRLLAVLPLWVRSFPGPVTLDDASPAPARFEKWGHIFVLVPSSNHGHILRLGCQAKCNCGILKWVCEVGKQYVLVVHIVECLHRAMLCYRHSMSVHLAIGVV